MPSPTPGLGILTLFLRYASFANPAFGLTLRRNFPLSDCFRQFHGSACQHSLRYSPTSRLSKALRNAPLTTLCRSHPKRVRCKAPGFLALLDYIFGAEPFV